MSSFVNTSALLPRSDRPRARSQRFSRFLVVIFLIAAGDAAATEPAFHGGFNGPDTTWKLLETGIPVQIQLQECVPGGVRDNDGAERIVLAAPAGQSAMLSCATGPVVVLDELQVSLWVKANRPDIQLAARIALPRTHDAQGGMATVIVRGSSSTRAGQWQQLTLTNVPTLLAAQVRILRATPGAKIDPREAFLHDVVLIVPGTSQSVELLTDELHVDGIVQQSVDDTRLTSASFTSPNSSEVARASSSIVATSGPRPLPPAASAEAVRLQGGVLQVDGKPFLPRVIQWRGESLEFLAERGFNSVELSDPPTVEQTAEAARRGLRFVCVPPRPEALERDGLGPAIERVLAWRLDDESIANDPQYARRWIDLIRQRETVPGRPVLIDREISRTGAPSPAEIVLLTNPRTAVLPDLDFAQWLDGCPPTQGGPRWVTFTTQFDELVGQQVNALTGSHSVPPAVDAEQVQSIVDTATTRAIRGFVFQSTTPLDAADAMTRARAATLELINLRSQLLEPWLVEGKAESQIASIDGYWKAVVLHVDRARLLMPVHSEISFSDGASAEPAVGGRPLLMEQRKRLRHTHGDGGPAGGLPARNVSFVIPGIPESSQAFLLSLAGLRTASAQRVAGGLRVTSPPLDGNFILVTEDPQVIEGMRQRIARAGVRFARLEREEMERRATLLRATADRLSQLGYRDLAATQTATSIQTQLPQIDKFLAAGELEQVSRLTQPLQQILTEAVAAQRRGVSPSDGLYSNPLALSSEQLADLAAFERSQTAVSGGENLLFAGDFEDLLQMTQFGWQHVRHPRPGLESQVRLSPAAPHQGAYCLELSCAATTADGGWSTTLTNAPLWIVSPPVYAETGQRIEITGMVRIDEPLTGGEGLVILDSLGGPELAITVHQTSAWQPFRLVRTALQPGELRVTFALAGVGVVRIDGVMIRAMTQPVARRLPPVGAVSK